MPFGPISNDDGEPALPHTMTDLPTADSYRLGSCTVSRLGYGAMQLTGPGVFGPPKDRKAAVAVLREAIAQGVNHIDTSDIYASRIFRDESEDKSSAK